FVVLAPWGMAGYQVLRTALTPPGICLVASASPPSLWRLVLCGAVIGLCALVLGRRTGTIIPLWTQGLLLGGTAAVLWWLLETPDALAAKQVPYRHVFGVL